MRQQLTDRLRRVSALAAALAAALAFAACKPKPAEVRVTPKKMTLYGLGRVGALSWDVLDSKGGTVEGAAATWQSSNPKVATVEPSTGTVTSVGAGKATVTASLAGSPLSGAATVEVVDIASLSVFPVRTTLAGPAGSSFHFELSEKDSAGKPLDLIPGWTSSDPRVATIDPQGTVRSVAEGRTTVTAKVGDVAASADVRVVFQEIAALEVAPTTLLLRPGDHGTLVLTARDPSGNPIPEVAAAWTTTSPAVATCSGGVVLALSPGSATIRAVCGTKSVEVTVIVT